MPAIPQYQQRTQATGLLGAGPTKDVVGAARIPQGLGELGAQAAETFNAIQVSKNAWQMADTTAKAMGELEQYRGELAADEDYDSHATKYLAKAKEIQNRVAQTTFKGSPVLGVWQKDFERAAQANAVSVQVDAQKLKVGQVQANLGNTLESLSELTGKDPATDEIVRNQANLAIEANAAAGNLSYEQRNQLRNKFVQDSAEAAIRRDMLSNPQAAEAKLASGAYPHLSGEKQAIWAQRLSAAVETEQRKQLMAEERQLRLSDKAKKDAADASAKNGDRLLAQGNMSADWIEAHRDILDKGDYRYFYKAMSGGEDAPRNPMIYADLRDKAGRGEDIRGDARDALHDGRIRLGDYDRLMNEVEQERPGWYKRGSQYISTMSGVSELNPDPSAAQTKATMLDQWGDWATKNPKASDREAQAAYQDIVSHNMLVQAAGLPLPKYTQGTRLDPHLDETEAATVKAFQSGEIDEATFRREASLLKQWRAATKPISPPKKPNP